MKKLLTLLLLATSLGASASHTNTTEISYAYTGSGNNYRIQVRLTGNCGGLFLSNQAAPIKISSSCYPTQTISIFQNHVDSFGSYNGVANGQATNCANPSTQLPGFFVVTYDTVVSLPGACADWKFAYESCCRQANIQNLVATSANTYVEATLNNTGTPNTNAIAPNHGALISLVNQGITFPMPAVDPDGDTVLMEWYQPQGTNGAPVSYAMGYNLSAPLGTTSTASINNYTQSLYINGAQIGNFGLAVRFKEYRNGTLIGTSTKDFTVMNLPNNTTTPLRLASLQSGSMTGSGCPGTTQTFNFEFRNEIPNTIAGDSIYVATATGANSPTTWIGAASVTDTGRTTVALTVNIPATLNPSQTPYQVFYLHTYNNRPRFSDAIYPFVLFFTPCQTDSVWAGDANGDYTVNILDPLAIAVAYGNSGNLRAGATTNWQAEWCADWNTSFINSINHKHADCNGDGMIDTSDLMAVSANWGQVHQRGVAQARTTGVPDLYFDLSGMAFVPGTTVSVPIVLGSANSPVNNFYGLGATVLISGITPNNAPSITYPANSWLGNGSNTIRFVHTAPSGNSTLHWAYARRNQQAVNNGQGVLAMLQFDIPANVASGQTVNLSFANTHLIDQNMQEITAFNAIDTFFTISTLNTGSVNAASVDMMIAPNPSADAPGTLFLNLHQAAAMNIQVADATGRVVWQQAVSGKAGMQQIALPELTAGIYFVQTSINGSKQQVLKWVCQ